MVEVSPVDHFLASSFRTLKKELGLDFLSPTECRLKIEITLQSTLRPNALHQVQPIVSSKNRSTLPKDQTTTLTHIMKFVADWFDFAEKENDPCDDSRDVVTNGGNSVQEKVVDCLEIATIEVQQLSEQILTI